MAMSLLPGILNAATISLLPASQNSSVDSIITVNVNVSSIDQSMNAISGVIVFPNNMLSLSSVSKTGSIVDFWAVEPNFSNDSGVINFEGVLLPPGFSGKTGKILSLNFKAKKVGNANVDFNSSSILAADGLGTNILTAKNGATIIVGKKLITETKNAGETAQKLKDNIQSLPEKPVITEYPTKINSGEPIVIKGQIKYPNSKIRILLKDENNNIESFLTKSDENGNFSSIISLKLVGGIYWIWAQYLYDKDTKFFESDKIVIYVESLFAQIEFWMILFITVTICLLMFLLVYEWYVKRKIDKEIYEAERAVHKAFKILRKSVKEQIKFFEKKRKTSKDEDEEVVVQQLKKDLKDAEKYIESEIEDIEDIVDR